MLNKLGSHFCNELYKLTLEFGEKLKDITFGII